MGQCVAQGYRSTGLGVTTGVIVSTQKPAVTVISSSGSLLRKDTRRRRLPESGIHRHPTERVVACNDLCAIFPALVSTL